MSNAAAQTFSRHAATYDADRRRLIPGFDDFYGAGLRLIAAEAEGRPLKVLDLGAGTGLMTGIALEMLPIAEITLFDSSEAMLDKARERLAGVETTRYQIGDFETSDLGTGWDAIISALAIHHLPDPEKQRLYARILKALKPGGRFVNAEQVLGPTPKLEAQYRALWDQDIRAAGIDDAGVAAAADRMKHDLCASTEDQLNWLREIGFEEVDCLYKNWRFAVLTGRAPE